MGLKFETDLALNHIGNTTNEVIRPFTDKLRALSGSTLDVDDLTNPPAGVNDARDRLLLGSSGGGVDYAFGSATSLGLPGDRLLFNHFFGLETHEYLAWWLHGNKNAIVNPTGTSGEELTAAQLATAGIALVAYPLGLQAGESAGWFKEAITHKKFKAGKWDDGSIIAIRLPGDARDSLLNAYPNITAPSATQFVSFLGDVLNGKYNAGEFQDAVGDSSQTNGLFPAYPLVDGSILDGQTALRHYYMGSWHTPSRIRQLWVNKPYFDGLTAQQKAWISEAANSAMANVYAESLQGRDNRLEVFQSLDAHIHESMPEEVLENIRLGSQQEMDKNAAADGTGQYTATLEDQRRFCRENQISWRAIGVDRTMRFARDEYQSVFQPNS